MNSTFYMGQHTTDPALSQGDGGMLVLVAIICSIGSPAIPHGLTYTSIIKLHQTWIVQFIWMNTPPILL